MELDGEPLVQKVENSVDEKPAKKKKEPRKTKTGEVDKRALTTERSEAQKAAAAKMVAALKAKRAEQQKLQEEEAARIDAEVDVMVKEKARVSAYTLAARKRAVKMPPIPQYVTTPMLDLAVRKILAAMPSQVERIPIAELPKPEVIERVHPVERVVVKEVAVPKQLSGNALLDSIFFK